jgi:hypothetical protein
MGPNARPHTEQPVYWFVRLEQALERGDFAAALNATDRLRQLGVTVRFNGLRASRSLTVGGPDYA